MEMGMQSPVITPSMHQNFGMAAFRFFLRLATLIFLTFDASAGLVYLLYFWAFRWVELIPTVLAIFCGLSAGLLARIIYKTAPRFIRWLYACVAAVGILAGLGLICRQWLEIDLTGISSALVEPDFFILFTMAGFSALLAIFSWNKKAIVVQPREQQPDINSDFNSGYEIPEYSLPQQPRCNQRPPPSRKRSFSIFPAAIQRRYFKKSGWRRVKKQIRTRWNNFLKFGKRSIISPISGLFQPGVRIHGLPKSSLRRLQIRVPEHRTAPPSTFPTPLPRKHPNRKSHQTVRLIGKEELRCPYCLQVIDRRDPKGIVVCPICHSAHHKECWDITGSCQVPHNHALL